MLTPAAVLIAGKVKFVVESQRMLESDGMVGVDWLADAAPPDVDWVGVGTALRDAHASGRDNWTVEVVYLGKLPTLRVRRYDSFLYYRLTAPEIPDVSKEDILAALHRFAVGQAAPLVSDDLEAASSSTRIAASAAMERGRDEPTPSDGRVWAAGLPGLLTLLGLFAVAHALITAMLVAPLLGPEGGARLSVGLLFVVPFVLVWVSAAWCLDRRAMHAGARSNIGRQLDWLTRAVSPAGMFTYTMIGFWVARGQWAVFATVAIGGACASMVFARHLDFIRPGTQRVMLAWPMLTSIRRTGAALALAYATWALAQSNATQLGHWVLLATAIVLNTGVEIAAGRTFRSLTARVRAAIYAVTRR